MSLQEPDIRCDWRTPFRPPHEGFPSVQCVEDATHVAFIGDRARPFCGRHSEHRAPGATLQHLIRDPRVGVLVAFSIAGYSDDTLDRLIADVVSGSEGADVVLRDYVEQSGMADQGYRVTFEGRTWLEGSWMRADVAERVLAALHAVTAESPATLIGDTWKEVFAGEVTWRAGEWVVAVFEDCGDWDYIESVTAPDGRHWEYDRLPDVVKHWTPSDAAGWPSLPASQARAERCGEAGCQLDAGHPGLHRVWSRGWSDSIVEEAFDEDGIAYLESTPATTSTRNRQ